jgi:hypothetical protein
MCGGGVFRIRLVKLRDMSGGSVQLVSWFHCLRGGERGVLRVSRGDVLLSRILFCWVFFGRGIGEVLYMSSWDIFYSRFWKLHYMSSRSV